MSNLFRRHKNGPGGKDVEAGGGNSGSTAVEPTDNLGEYPALERYISTYREDFTNKDEEDEKKGRAKRWWQFWKSSTHDTQQARSPKDVMPDSWQETDIHVGLSSADIDERRKMFGWNELAAEKENMLLKFAGFFTGPILYGEPDCCHFYSPPKPSRVPFLFEWH
jgi:H+-transporting ATPase